MNDSVLLDLWKGEERIAYIHGWDFSHIDGRYSEETDFPWDYRDIIMKYLTPEKRLLDTDTGGGEFLLSLGHPYVNLAATEGYPPNVRLCKEKLIPLGIDFREWNGGLALPYGDCSFDMVINRHGDLFPKEIYRVLKPGGVFITQQVGAENDRELVDLLLPNATELPFPDQYLAKTLPLFTDAGFDICESGEAFGKIRFFDVGALVWFARIIEWEFPEFSVDGCKDRLFESNRILQREGELFGRTHRFYFVANKRF